MADKVGRRPVVNRILTYLLVLALVVYAAVQAVGFFSSDVEISRLREYTTEEKVSAKGMFFRNERVISSNYAGGCDYSVMDGEKVALADRLAVIYESAGDSGFLDSVRNLELQIDSLRDIYEAGSLFDYDITRLDEQISQTIYGILDYADSGSSAAAQADLRELERLMNKRAIIDGSAQVTKEQIESLEAQLDAMTSGGGRVLESVYAPASGFFTSGYDGAEGAFTPDKLEDVTPGALDSMLAFSFSEQPPNGYVGAVVEGFEWTYAFNVSEEQTWKAGDTLTVRFPEASEDTVRASVQYVSAPENGMKTVVISSTQRLEMLSSARYQPVEVITKTYRGYRVDKDAVRYVDNVVGVYVLKGKIVTFAAVDIVYSADEYVIIRAAEGSSLVANDDVVIAGRDLYDGKIVKPS